MLADIRSNPLMLTDAYNLSHQDLKCNTDWEVSHIYNRTAPMILYGFNENVLTILNRIITHEMIDSAMTHASRMGIDFPVALFRRVVDELGGHIPLTVEAYPDGYWVPRGTPFAQIRNTVEGFGELVTWWEGDLLHSYFPSGCATEAFYARKYLDELQSKYRYDDSFLTRFHSFGFRGHRSLEDAYWAGTAWNLFLKGTDDFHTVMHTPNAGMVSISALAHKVTQQFDFEMDCYMNAIDVTHRKGQKVVAIVIDTYDPNRFIDQYAVSIANYAKNKGIHVVFRPDSGDVINQAIGIYVKCVQVSKQTNVNVIIGMDMSFEKARTYDSQLILAHVPLDFVSYGIGAGFYKHIERDTSGWSMKTAYSNGADRMKFSGTEIKQSIPGKIMVSLTNWDREEVLKVTEDSPYPNILQWIYHWDKNLSKPLMFPQSWDQIHETAMKQLKYTLPHEITISPAIKKEIAEIRKKYLGE